MPSDQHKTVTLKLPTDLLTEIEETARTRVLGRSLLIELLLRRALHDLEPPPTLPEPSERP